MRDKRGVIGNMKYESWVAEKSYLLPGNHFLIILARNSLSLLSKLFSRTRTAA